MESVGEDEVVGGANADSFINCFCITGRLVAFSIRVKFSF